MALSFKEYFRGDILILRLMGLTTMDGVFTKIHQPRWRLWQICPFLFGITIIIFTLICEFRTLSRVIKYDLNYAIEIFTAMCPGILCTTKVGKKIKKQKRII